MIYVISDPKGFIWKIRTEMVIIVHILNEVFTTQLYEGLFHSWSISSHSFCGLPHSRVMTHTYRSRYHNKSFPFDKIYAHRYQIYIDISLTTDRVDL